MNKSAALERLNLDLKYEDKLVSDLNQYFIDSLDSIPELTQTERDRLKLNLERISDDSKEHATLFIYLIELVLENADDKL